MSWVVSFWGVHAAGSEAPLMRGMAGGGRAYRDSEATYLRRTRKGIAQLIAW